MILFVVMDVPRGLTPGLVIPTPKRCEGLRSFAAFSVMVIHTSDAGRHGWVERKLLYPPTPQLATSVRMLGGGFPKT